MQREIKTTIAVDGEQAFKRAINEANNSMRNLGTQLTLAQAQFKKDGDAMKLMESRSKALKGEIGQQEEIVTALQRAVEDSSKAYGENSDKTEKWQAELNRAQAKLISLQSELTLNEAGLDRSGKAFDESAQSAADYQATLQDIGKGVSWENINTGIGNITKGFENAVQKVLGFANTLRTAMVDAGKWADNLITDATKYDMDVETLQRWQQAADFLDTNVETIIGARDKLGKKMASGWKDGKKDMWEFLGIDIYDSEGAYRDKMDVMWEVGETLMSMAKIDGNDVRADQYAMEVFGKSWRDLMPLFQAGREEWEKTVAEQRVVSEEHVKSLGEMDDANNKLENSWEVLKNSALATLAPTFTEITNSLSDLLNNFNDWMETDEGKQAMDDLAESIKELFSGIKDIQFKDAVEAVKKALNSIMRALTWLNENKDNVTTALGVIGGGFVAMKLGQVATNIGSIVSGFRTLWGGAGKPLPSMGGTGGGVATTAGGAAVKTGAISKLSIWLAANGGSLAAGATPVLVTVAAVAPAVIQQLKDEHGMTEDYEHTEEVANAAEDAGISPESVELARKLNAASGVKVNENGEYKRNFLGFLDLNPTDQSDWVLQSLSDPRKRGQIYSDIMTYGDAENDNVAGWRPWNALLRYWGEYTDENGRRVDMPLEQYEQDALIEYLRDLETRKLEMGLNGESPIKIDDAVSEMKVNTQTTAKAADKFGQMDLKRFNGLPAEIQTAAQRGTAAGMKDVRIEMSGESVARIVSPYINGLLGAEGR